MEFLKISIWLFTAILSVYAYSIPHAECPNCAINHLRKLIHDQRNCFCFNNQIHQKKVPEIIHPDRVALERLVFYVYKDLHSDGVKIYIPNKEKQILIPDLPFDGRDIITDDPSDILDSFNDLKVLIKTHHINNEPSDIYDYITAITTEQPTVTTITPSHITDEPTTVTNEKPSEVTEEPTVTTKTPTFPTEIPTTTTEKEFVTTKEPTTITTEPNIIIREETVTTDKSTSTTEGPTTIIDESSVVNKKPTITVITDESTTVHTPKIIIISEELKVTTKEPITTESVQPTVTTEEPFFTPEETTFNRKEPITEEPYTTKSPEPTITTAEPTTSEEPSPIEILPVPDDETKSDKAFSLKDLYKIIQFVQKKKDTPVVDLWGQILRVLKLDKSQVDRSGGEIEYDIADNLEPEHNYYTFDLWFEHQLDGFSENDNFISLAEIKEYVRKILLENGMIVTIGGLLTDLHGKILDLRELKLRPILIGKPLNIGNIFKQNDRKSDFLIPSDSPYMQAIVVTLSNPSMILGIIPLGKTTIQKTVHKKAIVPPPRNDMVQEWVQNDKKKQRQQNLWFNLNRRPKLALKDSLLHSLPNTKKIIKHEYFEDPKNSKTVITFNSSKTKYKVKPSRLIEDIKENDLKGLLENLSLKDRKGLTADKYLRTARPKDGFVPTGEENDLSLNEDDPIEFVHWENQPKDLSSSQKDLLTARKNNADIQTDGKLISSLNVNEYMEPDSLNNQLIIDSKLTPTNGLLSGWQHLGHLKVDNVKSDPIELDSWNHLVSKPILSEANEMLSGWQNRAKVHPGSRHVITFKADDLSELNALKNHILKHSDLFGKAGIKLLAALHRSETDKAPALLPSSETISYKVYDLKNLDKLKSQLLKDPKVFAKMAKKLLSALKRKGIVQAGTGEPIHLKIDNPRELEALRNQLLKHPKIFARAAKELLTVMEHNGIVLSDIAPVSNQTVTTSLEDSEPSAEKSLPEEEYLPSEKGPWTEDADSYDDEVEDIITGRIVGGSAATGSGAPLSMKGRMKDF